MPGELSVILSAYLKKRLPMLTMWGDSSINYLDLGNHFTIYIYSKSPHTLQIYTITCQLFLKKVKWKCLSKWRRLIFG